MKNSSTILCLIAALLLLSSGSARAGSYGFSDEIKPNAVSHPPGYGGINASFTTTICVDPTHPDAALIGTAMENIARTFSARVATSPNLFSGGATNIPSGEMDWESVALHELGHCLGLSHTNTGSSYSPDDEFTRSYAVTSGFSFDDGADNIDGSSDDVRDDDQSLVWFFKGVNNPFVLSSPVDSTTFSRTLSDLPGAHAFPTSATRDVGALLGYGDTEAVMKQLSYSEEAQRTLVADDVATLQYAMSGTDELAGTSDDYTFDVSYVGLTASCDIVFESSASTNFARCSYSASYSGDHYNFTSATAQFNPTVDWFYNDVSNATQVPLLPDLIAMGLVSLLLLATLRMAVKKP
ncbi:MAG: hypothetical protein GY725_20640 [bacterium]|nr:hypothetical protein [bacterium]